MNPSTRILMTRLPGLLLALFSSFAHAAGHESMRVVAQLRPATELVAPESLDPVVYNHYSTNSALASDSEHPHLGTALTYSGSGPQMAISAVRVFMHSRSAQAVERIRVELKFWGGYGASTSPVFTKSPQAGLVGVDLVGPFVLAADTVYGAIVELPEPVLVDAFASTGISMHVLAGSINDDPLTESTELLPAYDTASVGTVGSVLETYADPGGARTDHNFAPTDILRDGADPLKKLPLAITLYGKPQRMVQCGNWPSYTIWSSEEFDQPESLYANWQLSANNGNATILHDGSYVLQDMGGSPSYPYLTSRNTPIPPTGEFSVRWRARYLSTAANGTGSLVISRGLPVNGVSSDDLASRAAWVWQDAGSGLQVRVRTSATVNPPVAFQETAGAGTVVHDVEYCWLTNTVEIWVDGVPWLQQARNANVQRPDSLWIGNPVNTGDQGGQWNSLQLYRVQVRAPFGDVIFRNGFDAQGVN